jgi:galactokinase
LRHWLTLPERARAMHVVTETARTRTAATLLARGQLRRFGQLVNASHESCRRWFECSAPEQDLAVRAARHAGAWGARLTGAGWGGAVLVVIGPATVTARRESAIVASITRAFVRAYGHEPRFAVVRPGPGARRERVL